MSVTISETGGKLSKRERPKVLREFVKADKEIDLEELSGIGGISVDEMNSFLKGRTSPDMAAIDAMAEYLGVHLPEINVVDFSRSGYLPEAMVNFLALLGWNPGGDREIMPVNELIDCFDITRFAKSNSLFDRKKLLAFNTEHIRMVSGEKLLQHFKSYLKVNESAMAGADDAMLEKILKANKGARTLEDIETKTRFVFIGNDRVEYDDKAVKKVLLKHDGLAILKTVGERLISLEEITPETVEKVLRDLAEEKQVGLGKIAQPLRVAICGTTISPPIFDSVDLLGIENTLARIEITLEKFRADKKSLEDE
jgi:glutamyl-tRNA synthetase